MTIYFGKDRIKYLAEILFKFLQSLVANDSTNVPTLLPYLSSAFSLSKSNVAKVCKFILNQPEHHMKVTFQEEYEKFIKHYQETLIR